VIKRGGVLMKLKALKEAVRSAWETFNLTDGTPSDESLFKAEVRKYGKDLRRRSTWERAAIAFEVGWILGGLDNRDLIYYFCAPNTPLGQAYNQAVLDELLTHEDGLERLKDGLEELYQQPIRKNDPRYAMDFLKRISEYQEQYAESLSAIALPSVA